MIKHNSLVYKRAANLIKNEDARFCCVAIQNVTSMYDEEDALTLFEKYFAPNDFDRVWFGNYIDPRNQNDREFALLLMAEIARDMKGNNK